MVKTRGPLLSAEASGTLADQLTFLNTRRGNTVRRRVLPRDRKSGAQMGRRAAFHFITKNWSKISSGARASWNNLDRPKDQSVYNAFVAHNTQNWSGFLAPSAIYPVTRTGAVGVFGIGPAAAQVGYAIQFDAKLNTLNANWGIIIFASPSTAFSTAVENAISMEWLGNTVQKQWTWTPPNNGTWFFNARLFTVYGALGAEDGEFTIP